jgi:AcrR family transcriptional regulator
LISRERAVEAALDVIDEEGLEALTLGRLSKRLGVSAPSLYHHFADKTDILAAAARALLRDIPLPTMQETDDWKRWFVELSVQTYRHVLARPRAAKLLVEHFPRTLIFPAHELGSRVFAEAGVPQEAIATVIRGLERLVYGLILADAEAALGAQGDRDETVADDRWPAYRAALDANHWDAEQMFRRSVELFLRGVESEYARPRETAGSTGLLRALRRYTA